MRKMERSGAVKAYVVAAGLSACLTLGAVNAQPAHVFALPDAVAASLKVANLPLSAVGIAVAPVSGAGLSLAVNETQPMNPASTMKLVTTLAGLELLGPQYQWRTDVLSAAPLKNGVLEGDLWLRGSGDPQLVIEDLWLLVQRMRGAGVREIRGNLMLDRSAFEAVQHDPSAFDGEALRPYNAGPDALLLNYKAVSFHFIADPENKQARVFALPALAGMVTPTTVRGSEGACNDWRARLSGKDLSSESTRERRESGVGYIPEDRHRHGLLLDAPLWENRVLGHQGRPPSAKGPLIDKRGGPRGHRADHQGVRRPDARSGRGGPGALRRQPAEAHRRPRDEW